MERNTYPPIEHETRPVVDTRAAAYYLNRSPDTLRTWSCLGTGPVQPIRVGARLGWPTASIRQVLGVEVAHG